MHKTLTFNGVKKDWLYLLAGRQKSPFAPVRNNLITVPGMPGAYLSSKETGVLYIHQPIGFIVKDDEQALKIKDELAEWLTTEKAVPLKFDDEPGRTYFAQVDGTIDDFDRFVDQRRGTITFLCTDPFSYGPEQTSTFNGGLTLIENKGTAPSYPTIEMTATEPSTFALASDGHNYVMVGRPQTDEEQPFEKYERILTVEGNDMTGWTPADYVDGGTVAGEMESNGSRFQAKSFGEGSSWHGPAIKRSLPQTLSDFSIKTVVAFGNTRANYIGRIEMYLLDVNGNAIAKIGLKDNQIGRTLAIGEARVGGLNDGRYLISESGDRQGVWNDFYGVLQIEREDNRWRMYIAKINRDTGEHHSRRNVIWTDVEGLYTQDVAQVVLHVGTVGTNTPPAMGFYGVMVDKINKEQGVPYIVEPGDKVVFDNSTGLAFVNGEPMPVDFGSEFFEIGKGYTNLVIEPNTFNGTVKYRERWR